MPKVKSQTKPKNTKTALMAKDMDKKLWVQMSPCELPKKCSGKHFVIPTRATFPGRFQILCPVNGSYFRASLFEIKKTSTECLYWLQGFLHGSEPQPPLGISGLPLEPQDRLMRAYEKAMDRYRKDGFLKPGATYPFPSTSAVNWMLQVGLKVGIFHIGELKGWAERFKIDPDLVILDISWDLHPKWLEGICEAAGTQNRLVEFLESFGTDHNALSSFELIASLIPDFKKLKKGEAKTLVRQLTKLAEICLAGEAWKDDRDEVLADLAKLVANPDHKKLQTFKSTWAYEEAEFFIMGMTPIHWRVGT